PLWRRARRGDADGDAARIPHQGDRRHEGAGQERLPLSLPAIRRAAGRPRRHGGELPGEEVAFSYPRTTSPLKSWIKSRLPRILHFTFHDPAYAWRGRSGADSHGLVELLLYLGAAAPRCSPSGGTLDRCRPLLFRRALFGARASVRGAVGG